MTYPTSGGTPDPFQPQQPYSQPGQPGQPQEPYSQPGQPQPPYGPPNDPTAPYSPAPSSGQPFGPPTGPGEQPAYGPPPTYGDQPYGQPTAYGQPVYGQPPYGGQSPYGASPYGGYPGQRPTNALAIASLCCSLGGLVTCISAPVGIVLGHVARRQIRQTGEQGEGLATAGLWVGYILTVLGLVGVLAWLALVAFAIGHTTTTT